MKNIKISNGLLSSVFRCDCEFVMILKNDVVFRCENDRCNENVFYDEFHQCNLINLDTFIRLAKNGHEMYSQERDLNMLESALSEGKLNGFKRKRIMAKNKVTRESLRVECNHYYELLRTTKSNASHVLKCSKCDKEIIRLIR